MNDTKMKIEGHNYNEKIAILTPVYNRAYTLEKLHKSLLNQKKKNFDWYVINDGSTDSTETLMKEWISCDNGFQIYYYKKENGGKHRAINYVIPYISNEFTFIVDSDDYLLSDATLYIEKWILSIRDNKNFAGVAGLRGYPSGEMIGEYPKGDKCYIDAKNIDRIKKHLTGDKAEIYRTSILKKYPFPEIDGEKFIPESVVWNEIALDGYELRWYNQIIYITEYLEDGLTMNLKNNRLENWKGYTLDTALLMKYKNISKYRYLGRYIQLARERDIRGYEVCRDLRINSLQYLSGKIIAIFQELLDLLRKGSKI